MRLTVLEGYIATRVAVATGLVALILLGLTVFFAFVDGLKEYGQVNFGLYELVRYVLLVQPRKLYDVFPVATLIGALLGLSSLAVNAELVAMRAAGVSVLRIIGAAMKMGLVLALMATALGEFVVPAAENEAKIGRAQALSRAVVQQRSGVWMRDEGNFINIGEVLPDLSLLRVNIYAFENDIRLRVHTRAERAVFTPPSGWRLEEVVETHVGDARIKLARADTREWQTSVTRDTMGVFTVRPEQLSMRDLVRYIRHLQRNGQSTERYRLALWQKAMMPLAVVVMVLLATPFALGQMRGGGLSRRIFLGVMIGLAFVIVTRSFGHFGLIYGIAPVVGAVAPILLFLGGALVLLRRAV